MFLTLYRNGMGNPYKIESLEITNTYHVGTLKSIPVRRKSVPSSWDYSIL